MKLLPWWLAPFNLYVYIKAHPYMATFEGLSKPWSLLETYVSPLESTPIHFGTGYIASGNFKNIPS